ncbi:hypothetical protein AA23498_1928 [Acetobacter nitrogenifigens DSM 23921 = NBRC 105050]|uniref:Peptidase M61 n=1 Tax=Acetobacter nitrogenifigens DSM 23921 = NBRC 105050 TaxID=1120919 RepID=A0A511XCF9_9PROT|nr:M61 family metallopeptidase [Acetobacter nitrogenifigens]GBQ94118.1 hypothetical protein AA23498_1928 [Acetobacter nitrogenifigens DSM 23921 = NBRC 105050]GEN60565.1 peptidase M61 [Acetobacter nitrogenifigens DSM 23921 = NBRC 105050]
MHKRALFLLTSAALLAPFSNSFASDGPQPLPLPAKPPVAQDTPYPGTIDLHVVATDLDRHILSVSEHVPVPAALSAKGGDMVLLYPSWLPGNHSPTGPITQLGGLVVKVSAKTATWTRDTVDVNAFHIAVPAGAQALDVSFQTLSPITPEIGRVVMTPAIVNVQWNQTALYPAGYYTRDIPFRTSLTLPHGWGYGTALRPDAARKGTQAAGGDEVTFGVVPFNTLVDSPLFAGRYFRRIELTKTGDAPVSLDLVADRPEYLAATDEQIAVHRALVEQAQMLFGSHHYDHYDFLLALTNELGRIGLEHHQSSENSGPTGYFSKWDKTFPARDLLAHEYTHSWNGKFRRPADLWAPDFNTPQRGSLLWVYEGQTQYWGYVLAARAGLMTADQAKDAIAMVAATYDTRAGRTWRPLQDTTNDPVIAQRAALSWRSWQRSEDYYSEGQLVWLDADTLIRSLSGGKRSLDDFARAFFGVDNGSVVTRTYRFEDVVAALNGVQPYDWATFLRQRLDAVSAHAPLDGLARGGYALSYTDEPTPYIKAYEAIRKMRLFDFSIGFSINSKGMLTNVLWGGPSWKVGIAAGESIVAVNRQAYDADDLSDAIEQAKDGKAPISLLVRSGDRFRTVSIDYHGGLRYPHLVRLEGKDDVLGTILAARK